MLILGIETSCDETAAAVVEDGRAVRSNVIASQHDLHRRYQGVVPEIASRAHVERITPVIDQALSEARISFEDLDAVSVGHRPGLIGSLIVGLSAAKAIAWSLGKPLIGVDHVQAHLHAPSMYEADNSRPPPPQYPALGLVVSGGHTSLYALDSTTRRTLLGRTIDDAVGEAYDKAAVILALDYPGGPNLDRLARNGDAKAYQLPRSTLAPDSLDFSFSGLKTATLYTVRGKPRGRGGATQFERSADDLTEKQRTDIAASFQAAAIDTLMIKLERAMDVMAQRGNAVQSLLIGGGVSANSLLRERALALGQDRRIAVHIPAMAYCMDNAAMIAGLAYEQHRQGHTDGLDLPAVATATPTHADN